MGGLQLKASLIALGVISILVVVGVSLAIGSTTSTSTQLSQSGSMRFSSITTSSSLMTTVTGNTSSATSVASNGIMLNVTISALSLASGDKLNITDEAFNTLSAANNVSAATNWPFPSLRGQCPGGIFNDVLYKGYYTSSNISSGTLLPWNPPGNLSCPAINFGYYIFKAHSDLLTAYPNSSVSTSTSVFTEVAKSCSLSNDTSTFSDGSVTTSYSIIFCTTSTISYTSSSSSSNTSVSGVTFAALSNYPFNEYYDSNSSSMTYFASGEYSLLVGDIWGNYVIMHFSVN
jgi:hypothetical protein